MGCYRKAVAAITKYDTYWKTSAFGAVDSRGCNCCKDCACFAQGFAGFPGRCSVDIRLKQEFNPVSGKHTWVPYGEMDWYEKRDLYSNPDGTVCRKFRPRYTWLVRLRMWLGKLPKFPAV